MDGYRLSEKAILRLKQEHRKAKTKFEADRLKAVYLLGEGWESKTVAHILDKDERTIVSVNFPGFLFPGLFEIAILR